MRTKLLAVTLVAAGATAGAAFAAAQMGPTVGVTLKEFKVLAPASSKAGKIKFVVRNKGQLKHEFLVVKTKRAASKLPVKGSAVKLKGLDVRGKLAPFAPGKTKSLSLKLKAGKYVLFCNLPGHYRAGQYKAFKVS
jgi:uncharacterized cupredoxin-like copper-binding protein